MTKNEEEFCDKRNKLIPKLKDAIKNGILITDSPTVPTNEDKKQISNKTTIGQMK